MATKSFTTDYKFNNKEAKKLVNAMNKSEDAQVNRPNVFAQRLKTTEELQNFMSKVKVNEFRSCFVIDIIEELYRKRGSIITRSI
ncbi:hypothetical protein KU511_13735 (plasmid) [Staphylococcus aureus]|uniref:hypothetical protein n=1 Tax=Staphylococcus aureus TaxID=1280 RepID=UPI001CECFC5C|nr:hypothetical protein [Staphylococcus aureus]UCK44571.1 hypothetical protein KU511_13735 [Staphylococcus aureus]